MRCGQRPRSGRKVSIARSLLQSGHMDDQRVEIRTAFRGIDLRYRFGTVSPRGEAIDRLGRHRD